MRFVYGSKVRREVMEARKGVKKRRFDQVPIPLKEGRTKTIGTRARVIIHGEQGRPNLLKGERADESGCLRGPV
jgi:hypothetical protein